MATAVVVRDDVRGFAGPATLYRVDPPMKGTEFLLLYFRPEFQGQEGQLTVLLATRNGASFTRDVRAQQGSHVTRDPNHALALQLAGGYQIVDVEPVLAPVEVEPTVFDPALCTVEEVLAYLDDADAAEQVRVLEAERSGLAREEILGTGN